MNSALKMLQKHEKTFDISAIRARQSEAYAINTPWDDMVPGSMREVLRSYSMGIGVPGEFFFFPLLTASAAMMNTNSRVKLTPMWSEPPIVRTIVASRKGEKKSAAMRIIIQAVKDVETFLSERDTAVSGNDGEVGENTVTNSQFTFAKLFDQMGDRFEHQSGASHSWKRSNKANGSACTEKTLLNYTGFLQPTIAIAMLNMDDFDWFNDRHVAIICPKRTKTSFEELIPPPPNYMKFGDILIKLRTAHENPLEYSLCTQARVLFGQFYTSIEERKDAVEYNEDHRGVLAKCQGQLASLAMVVHALFAAVDYLKSDKQSQFVVDTSITVQSMEYAIAIIELCIEHKFALMPPCKNTTSSTLGKMPNKYPLVLKPERSVLKRKYDDLSINQKYEELTTAQ